MVFGQLAFTVLVVLMGSAWGVVSLWAANSKFHLAFRLGAVALPLGLFVSVPAYEPVLFFALQATVVAVGVAVAAPRESEVSRLKFSLKSLLIGTLVASALLTVAARTNIPSRWTGLSLVAGSVSLGITTLLAAWTTRPWSLTKPIVAVVCLAVASIPVGLWDSLVINFPEWDKAGGSPAFFAPGKTASQVVIASTCFWFGILLATYLLLMLTLFCWSLFKEDGVAWKKRLGTVGIVSLLAMMVLPVACVYVCIPPAPVGRTISADSNGYDVLVEAGDHFVNSGAIDFPQQATDAQLAAAMQKNAKAISMVRDASRIPFEPPRDWNINAMLVHTQFIRSMARVFMADSILARRQGRIDDVITNSLDIIQLAHRTDESNLMTGLVSIAVESMGHQMLAGVRQDLNEVQSRRVIEVLTDIDANATTLDEVMAAEAAWAYQMYGWRRQLYIAMSTVGGVDDLERINVASEQAKNRSATVRRLLLIDIAIRDYQRREQSLPNSLAELSLDAALFVDGFSHDGSQILYERDEDSYKLYSIGPDGIDSGGVPIGVEEWVGDGDFLLESLYPDTSDKPSNAAN